MASRTSENLRRAERELSAYRHRFTPDEEELFGARRYLELANQLRDRARQQYLKAVAVLVSTEFVPIVYLVLVLLVFELGPWEAIGGFALLAFVFGFLPVRIFIDRHRMKQAATRGWAAALEAERGPFVEDSDITEVVDRMGDNELRMLEGGRISELADHMRRHATRAERFLRGFSYVTAGLLVVVPFVAFLLGGPGPTFATWPLLVSFASLLLMSVVIRREQRERARAARRLQED